MTSGLPCGFLRAPLPTTIAWLSIALSGGAAAVVFAGIKAVLIDPLPYARPPELVQIRSGARGWAGRSPGFDAIPAKRARRARASRSCLSLIWIAVLSCEH